MELQNEPTHPPTFHRGCGKIQKMLTTYGHICAYGSVPLGMRTEPPKATAGKQNKLNKGNPSKKTALGQFRDRKRPSESRPKHTGNHLGQTCIFYQITATSS